MERPVSVTVLGILNILFGALGMCGTAFSAVMFALPMENPAMDAMKENPAYMNFLRVSSLLGLIAAIVLIVAGIGLLRLNSWGRTLSIGYAVYAIIAGIVGAIANYVFVLQPMMDGAGNVPEAERAGRMMGIVAGSVVGTVIGLAYPIVLLVFMYRSNVVAAFRKGPAAEEPSDVEW